MLVYIPYMDPMGDGIPSFLIYNILFWCLFSVEYSEYSCFQASIAIKLALDIWHSVAYLPPMRPDGFCWFPLHIYIIYPMDPKHCLRRYLTL